MTTLGNGAVGVASWYGEDHRGKLMANGRPFDPDALTCATWDHPFGTRLKVTTMSGIWVVQKGETLTGIAKKHSVSLLVLLQLNPAIHPDRLKIGQRVNVPAKADRSVIVTVTDRGPNKRLHRLIDLSAAAFNEIHPADNGLVFVKVELCP